MGQGKQAKVLTNGQVRQPELAVGWTGETSGRNNVRPSMTAVDGCHFSDSNHASSYCRFSEIFRTVAAHLLIPPWPLMNALIEVPWALNASATRNARDHLLRVLASTLFGAEVQRITTEP
jgi:hypothetical protein